MIDIAKHFSCKSVLFTFMLSFLNISITNLLDIFHIIPFNFLPTLNPTVLDALILIASPVCGFLPFLAFLVLTRNVPKPTNWTFLSFFNPLLIPFKTAFIALSPWAFETFNSFATDSIKLCLFTIFSFPVNKYEVLKAYLANNAAYLYHF